MGPRAATPGQVQQRLSMAVHDTVFGHVLEKGGDQESENCAGGPFPGGGIALQFRAGLLKREEERLVDALRVAKRLRACEYVTGSLASRVYIGGCE